jgi:hypothetical protein
MRHLSVEAAHHQMSKHAISKRGDSVRTTKFGAFWVRKHEACQELLYELAQPRTADHVSELEQPRPKYDAAELNHGAGTLRDYSRLSAAGHTNTQLLVYRGSRTGADTPKANLGGTTFVLSNETTQLERSEKLRYIGLRDWLRELGGARGSSIFGLSY